VKEIRLINDLGPDGVRIIVNWDKMVVGASAFVPCVNTSQCKKEVVDIAKRLGFSVECRVVVEDQKLGVRVWRLA
jgi:hypothetical protein